MCRGCIGFRVYRDGSNAQIPGISKSAKAWERRKGRLVRLLCRSEDPCGDLSPVGYEKGLKVLHDTLCNNVRRQLNILLREGESQAYNTAIWAKHLELPWLSSSLPAFLAGHCTPRCGDAFWVTHADKKACNYVSGEDRYFLRFKAWMAYHSSVKQLDYLTR